METIFQKLGKIQFMLKAPKTQYNKFGGYHYRKAEDIMEAVKPILHSEGCSLICSDELVQMGDRYYVKATVTLVDIASGTQVSTTAWAREEAEKKGMDGSQITGASSSYARKYALNGLLCIDDTQDSDTTNVGDGKTTAKKTVPAPMTQASIHDRWVKAIATKAVNSDGVAAEDAYREKFHPTDEQWKALQAEVLRYQLDNEITEG